MKQGKGRFESFWGIEIRCWRGVLIDLCLYSIMPVHAFSNLLHGIQSHIKQIDDHFKNVPRPEDRLISTVSTWIANSYSSTKELVVMSKWKHDLQESLQILLL